jgi:adenylate cyclase
MMRDALRLARRLPIAAAIGLFLLAAVVLLRIGDPLPLEMLRLRTFDVLQTIRPRESTERPVVIVDLDDASLKALGQWPWPRTLLADLVQRLTDLGAVAIGFDVIFPEPDRTSPSLAAEAMRGLDEETRAKLRQLPGNDQVFAEALRASNVVLGQSGLRAAVVSSPGDGAPALPARVQTNLAVLGPDPKDQLVTFPLLLENVPVLEHAAAGRGLISMKPERDAVIRRVPLISLAHGVVSPALTIDMLRVATQSDALLLKADAVGVRSVVIAGFEIPTDGNGQLWPHFNKHDPSRYIPAVDVLEGRLPAGALAGKLVLIGTSAVGLLDIKATPLDAAIPGVEIHAQVIENILTQSALSRPSSAVLVEIGITVLVGLAIIGFSPYLGAGVLFLLGGGIAASLVGLAWYYFVAERYLFDLSFPFLGSFSVYLVTVFANYLQTYRERSRIRTAFQQYLAPALVDQLSKSPEKLVLGGEQRDMTVMFSDVRGFTAISELYRDDPQGLTSLMNRLLTPLTNAIIHEHGTIDKYIGDSIMAFWSAPLHVPDHEYHACEAALQMLDRLAELNAARHREAESAGQAFIPLRIGIGINAGPCVVGNMGSDLHFNYSVLGDAVNLASRLESQSKSYGVPILVGSRVARAVEGRFALVELDLLQVVGKGQAEAVFTIVGRRDVAQSREFEDFSVVHAAMLEKYRSGDWEGALEAILQGRELAKGFDLEDFYTNYVGRIRKMIASPPENWRGIYVAQNK